MPSKRNGPRSIHGASETDTADAVFKALVDQDARPRPGGNSLLFFASLKPLLDKGAFAEKNLGREHGSERHRIGVGYDLAEGVALPKVAPGARGCNAETWCPSHSNEAVCIALLRIGGTRESSNRC
jgi:hypothetical protein